MIGVAMASEHIGELKKWVSELSDETARENRSR